jgi:nucleotide-binding universal stress UspA family protein
METQEKIILAPTDFTEISYNAIDHGAVLAKLIDAKLYLLHVFSSDSKAYVKKEGPNIEVVEEKLAKKANEVKSKYGIEVVPMVHLPDKVNTFYRFKVNSDSGLK